ncbi:MAG: hypothetical protein ACKOAP_04975 [Vulcanococcus sp.]
MTGDPVKRHNKLIEVAIQHAGGAEAFWHVFTWGAATLKPS